MTTSSWRADFLFSTVFSPSRVNSATSAHIHWLTIVIPSYYGVSCKITFKIFTAGNKLCNLQYLRIIAVESHPSHLAGWDWTSKPIKLTQLGEREVWERVRSGMISVPASDYIRKLTAEISSCQLLMSEHDLPSRAFWQLSLAGLWTVWRVRLHWTISRQDWVPLYTCMYTPRHLLLQDTHPHLIKTLRTIWRGREMWAHFSLARLLVLLYDGLDHFLHWELHFRSFITD